MRCVNLIDEYSERKTLRLNLKDFKGEDSFFDEGKLSSATESIRHYK